MSMLSEDNSDEARHWKSGEFPGSLLYSLTRCYTALNTFTKAYSMRRTKASDLIDYTRSSQAQPKKTKQNDVTKNIHLQALFTKRFSFAKQQVHSSRLPKQSPIIQRAVQSMEMTESLNFVRKTTGTVVQFLSLHPCCFFRERQNENALLYAKTLACAGQPSYSRWVSHSSFPSRTPL